MLNSFRKKAKLKSRALSLLLAVVLVLSLLTVGLTATISADTSAKTFYFDTTKYTDWEPSTGEQLVATFTNSSGAQVGSVVSLTKQKANLWSLTAPAGSANIQLYVVKNGFTMLSNTPAAGKQRVFFNNAKANWNPPKVYTWNDSSVSEKAWPGNAMTQIGTSKYYYYDTPYNNVIFNNGSDAQTDDLKIEKPNPVFSKASGSGWDNAAYYKCYANVDLTDRPENADVIYATGENTTKFSKYAYKSTDPRDFTDSETIYLYAPNWTDASKVQVGWDYNDPYQTKVNMTPDSTYGTGFYTATVPQGATLQFWYGEASSKQTVSPQNGNDCYTLKNNANIWCNPATAENGEYTDLTAGIEARNQHQTGSAFWVDAVYYDYLSDTELTNGWLNPKKAGTGHNGSADDWYENYQFNNLISAYAGANGVTFPLYFGNFCNTPKAHGESFHDGGYGNAIKGLYNYYYYVNNSNGMPDLHYAVQGLAGNALESDGTIRFSSGARMPYFDSTWLKDTQVSNRSIGTTVASYFPFRQTDLGEGVTKYSFDSQNGTDNVFFNWSGSTPSSVGYSTDAANYGVDDGLKYFMYNTASGKGIFPFNRQNTGNGGNNNLDYGFGIKMEMDFRIPEHNGVTGVLPNGQDCKFSFSGDDDLWVYISELKPDGTPDYENAILALDLGGNHKQAEGEINFRTRTATTTSTTKAVTATQNINFKSDTIYVEDSYNWGSMWMHAWDGDTKDFQMGSVTINGKKYYTATLAQMGNCKKFLVQKANGDWTNKSADATITSHYGNVTYANNPNWIGDANTDVSFTSNNQGITYSTKTKTDLGFADLSGSGSDGLAATGAGNSFDPKKTYHMSVFYMERGMVESNCKIEFTMTPIPPAENEFTVEKIVNKADVNAGLKEELSETKFDFATSENDTVDKAAEYKLNGYSDETVDPSTGKFQLRDEDSAYFNNQYATGSTLKVTETKPSSGINYGTTTWKVINNNTGNSTSGSGLSTNDISFDNGDNSFVSRTVVFTNTPDVGSLNLSKTIVDDTASHNTVSDITDEFSFKLEVDMNGGNNYQGYPLRYTLHTANGDIPVTTDDDGTFSFEATDSVTISGLPVGATYKLTELPATGYKPYQIKQGSGSGSSFTSGVFYPTVSTGSSDITVTNMQSSVTAELSVKKSLQVEGTDSELPYITGSDSGLFSFKAEGLGATPYTTGVDSQPVNTISVAGTYQTVSKTGADGEAVFTASSDFLNIKHAGAYLYKLTEETTVNGTTPDSLDPDDMMTYKSDFSTDTHQYLALIMVDQVSATDTSLEVKSVEYYNYDGTSAIGISTFDDSNKITTDTPEFVNTIEAASVKVEKKSTDGSKLENAAFSLYKVTGDGDSASMVDANRIDGVAKNTDENGIIEWSNLDIYAHTDSYTALPEYQWYALVENTAPEGHAKDNSIIYFTLPMVEIKNGTPTVKYDVTYKLINGALKNPDAAGPGMAAVRNIGIAIVALASVLLLAYVLFFRKKKAYVPQHGRK